MKKSIKKLLSVGLASAMMISLAACGGSSAPSTSGGNSSDGNATTENASGGDSKDTEQTSESNNSESDSGSGAGSGASTGDLDLEAMTAQELSIYMGNGINLGNTFEAADQTRPGSYADNNVTYFETLWGQPVTTKEMIDDMKAAGLDTIRIPVAWANTMHYEDGDFTISPEYLARVKEVVDYAYDNDMFVVVNDHWDGDWWGLYGAKDESKRELANTIYTEMWTQVAEYFKDYDAHLIFEGGNEEIGDRLTDIGNVNIVDGNTLSKDELYAKANEINQTFVDLIRSTGGNNATRFLLIPGYGTDITQTLDSRWHMPTDTVDGKLFLSVHYYTPWSYCGSSGSSTWGTQRNYEEMNTIMKNLSTYVDQGYGIIIGECGVLPTSNGEMKPNWKLWYDNFFANCDLYNYVPLLWNTGDILKKDTRTWIDDEVKDFLVANSYASQSSLSADEVKANAENTIADGLAAAPETFDTEQMLAGDGTAIAWIMWDSQDWNIVYSVGDTYDPDSKTAGVVAKDVQVTGEGTYTIGLDFTGTDAGVSRSTAFSAIGIANAEELFPGYVINIKEILVNGEPYKMAGRNYTSSDDDLCTRSNLYNEWVGSVPDDARTVGGGTTGCTPCVIDNQNIGDIYTIEITFDYLPGSEGISTNDANSKN